MRCHAQPRLDRLLRARRFVLEGKKLRVGARAHGVDVGARPRARCLLESLLGITLENEMESTTMTSKGQVTIPKSVRMQLGLRQGTRVAFVVEGDHAVLRPAAPQRAVPKSGFGMVKVNGPAVPPDFDVASLLKPEPAKRPRK
jgi:AbrB family looped-hinge helix DNA binding protein